MAKYKAVLVEHHYNGHKGKWAVGYGKKYFLTMVYDTQKEAERAAAIETLRWHYEQIQNQVEVIAELDGVHWAEVNWHDYAC